MRKHIVAVHEGKKPYQCDICDATFTTQSGIKKHFKVQERKKTLKNLFQINNDFCIEYKK